jgi:hypothetical protein
MRWILKITGYALLAAVFALCLRTVPPQIESDLLATTQARLKQQQYNWAMVSIDGRDLLLSGSPPNDDAARKATNLVRNIAGVRKVDTDWVASIPASGSSKIHPPAATVDIATISTVDRLATQDDEITTYEDLITLPVQSATNYEITQ